MAKSSASREESTLHEGKFAAFLRWFRHPIRMLAFGIAVTAVMWGVAPSAGLVCGVIGAALGVILGEFVGRSRVRTPVLLATGVASLLGALLLSHFSTSWQWVAEAIGPGTALSVGAGLRFGLGALAVITTIRAFALRSSFGMALEVGSVVVGLATLFAPHRHGIIARPLWLSDWAWQQGFDPADVLLAVGAVAAISLAALLVLERKGSLSLASVLVLPLLALIAIACLDVAGTPQPQGEQGLNLTAENDGEQGINQEDGRPRDGTGNEQEDGRDPNENGPEQGGQDQSEGDAGTSTGGDAGDAGTSSGEDAGDGGSSAGDDAGDGGSSSGDDAGDAGSSEGEDAGDGGSSAGDDAGDGGNGGGGQDAGADGGSGGGGGDDAGDGGSSAGQDAGDGGSSGGQDASMDGGASDARPEDDLSDLPPPTVAQDNNGGGGGSGQAPPSNNPEEQNGGAASSPHPVAVVIFETDYTPPSQMYYFRQQTMEEWNGARLVPATIDGLTRDTLDAFPVGRQEVADPPPEEGRQEVRGRVAVIVEHNEPFALESAVAFTGVRNPNTARFRRAYRFESRAQIAEFPTLFGRKAGNPAWSEEVAAMYVQGHDDPRFRELAEQIIEEKLPLERRADPFAQVVAIKLWLDKNLIYSTAERHANVADPTVDFLFGNRIGYCVHFAHAAVLLWRSLGIPAREATGYAVEADRRGSGSALLVKGGDAHAWPEVYIEGMGWVVIDIAAEQNLDPPGQPADEDMQRLLGEMAREQPADPEEEISDEPPPEPRDYRGLAKGLGIALLILLGLVILALYTTKLWRRLVPAFASATARPRVAYRAALDRLAEVGVARDFGETREDFAKRAESVAPSFAELTKLHVAARLSAGPIDQRDEFQTEPWRKHMSAFRSELSGSTKWWRRALGLLHPASFLDSR